jgi:hypothetical protein
MNVFLFCDICRILKQFDSNMLANLPQTMLVLFLYGLVRFCLNFLWTCNYYLKHEIE